MVHFEKLYIKTRTLSIFAQAMEDEGAAALIKMIKLPPLEQLASLWAKYFLCLANAGKTLSAADYFNNLVYKSDNVFNRRAALKQDTQDIGAAVERELLIIKELADLTPNDFYSVYKDEVKDFAGWTRGASKAADLKSLSSSVSERGYGEVYGSCAFTWDDKKKTLVPVENVNPIRLSDLKEYEDCKRAVAENTLSFIEGLPANNVLLYGDRGTGKSSTVHAVLNEYDYRGLRLIEAAKSSIPDFPLIMKSISRFAAFKFIIFIDDLTFIEGEDDYAQLKAALEGSVVRLSNVLIYATTNRRHLLKESHSDRTGDIHEQDTIQEQLSLSDRFGLVVTYINPDKREFLEILKQILESRGIELDGDVLSGLAERYALKKGGRSPRAAKQLSDMIESRLKKGRPLEELF